MIVRGAFLDYFFGAERIQAAVKGWVNRTLLKDRVQLMASSVAQIWTLVQRHRNEVPWDDEISHEAVREAIPPFGHSWM